MNKLKYAFNINKIALCLALIVFFNTTLYAQIGQLDNTFGINGIVKQDIAGYGDYAIATAVQADGKILIAGFGHIDTITYNDFVIVRYLTNGVVDSSFGVNGIVSTTFGSSDDEAWSICLQNDGKIILAGRTLMNNNYDFAIARYNSNGSLDNTFDNDGKVITEIGGINDYANCVQLQADNKIVVTGFTNKNNTNQIATIRYNINGSLDNSFDGDGIATTSIGKVYIDYQSMRIQADGKIITCATTVLPPNIYDILVVRYLPNGSLDTAFSNDGILTQDICYTDHAMDLALQQDGKIVVVGTSYDTVNINMGSNIMLVRFYENGMIDSSFGNNGIVNTEATNIADYANAVKILSNGKILIIGRSADGVANFQIVLAQYLPDGSLDNDFGNSGIVTTDMAYAHEFGQGLAIQNDGKIIATGFINNGSNFNMFVSRYSGDAVWPTIVDDISKSQFKIFPNPSSGIFTLSFLGKELPRQYSVCDIYGRRILKQSNIVNANFELDLSNNSMGIYFLQMFFSDGKMEICKLVKSK